jgi:hypothetical protein
MTITQRQVDASGSRHVTQSDIDSLLLRAGLPLDEKVTQPPPVFGAEGFDLYEGYLDPRGYLRPALTVSSSLLSQPMY